MAIFKKEHLLLFLILLLFLATRFYKISEVPPSLYWDEASIGYNAYSIAQTGKDEWGAFMPLHFKAFGEYKLPLYIYSAVLPVKLFGLNEFSVRLPAVIFSFFNILLIYFLAKRISGKVQIGLLSAFFLSISPYMFIFSRTGYEAVSGLTFFLLGVLLFLVARRSPLMFIFSGLSFAVSMYAYNGYRILSPLVLAMFGFSLLYSYRFRLLKIIPVLFFAAVVFIGACYPIARFLTSNGSINRYQAVGIENLDRKKVFVGFDIAKNYLAHFNPSYLFINGDKNLRSQMAGFGELYIYDAALLALGLAYLWRRPKGERWIIALMLLGFVPAALTRETPHALRSLAAAPFLAVIFSYGVLYLQERFTGSKSLILGVIIAAYLGLFAVYFNNFLNVYSSAAAKDWQEGYKLVFQKYQKEFGSFDHVLISDRYSQPYIFALAYLSYSPDLFRSTAVYNTDIREATSAVKSFDKFIFTNVDYHQLPKGKTLIFSHPTDRMNELPLQDIIYHNDGSVAFYVYEKN